MLHDFGAKTDFIYKNDTTTFFPAKTKCNLPLEFK